MSDITYIRLGNDFVYLAIVMDVFTRVIHNGWHLGCSLHQELTLTAFTKAIANGHIPTIHHSIKVQYTAADYIALLTTHKITISMAEVGAAWQNGYCVALCAHSKEEEVDLSIIVISMML